MGKKSKKNIILLIVVSVFWLFKNVFWFLIILIVYVDGIIGKLDDVKKDFSGFVGDTTSCAYDEYSSKLYFENHKVDLEKNNYGKFCGGVSLYGNSLFTCVNSIKDGINSFRIIESDVYYDNQTIFFEKEFDYKLDAESYNNVIYFGRKKSSYESRIDIMTFDIELREYIGLVSSGKKKKVKDYVYSIKGLNQFNVKEYEKNVFLHKGSYLKIKKVDTSEAKYITKSNLKNNEVGKVICKQDMWYWSSMCKCINDKIFLICVIEASTCWHDYIYYNVVFEYDFENDILKYRFRYISSTNEGIKLLFGNI